MHYNFDEIIDRTGTSSKKWHTYDSDVLPMWIADMDFRSPEPVIRALADRVAHGVFGYEDPTTELAETICAKLMEQYHWQVKPEELVFLPGLVSGINVACQAFAQPGEGVLVQTPVYPPFLSAPRNHGRSLQVAPLTPLRSGPTLSHAVDPDVFAGAIEPCSRMFLLCHPHNPTGVSYPEPVLRQMADACLQRDLVICSDEIHCDLLLGGASHVPMATLSPEIADRCVTLMAPSKTYNIAGLGCSFAVVQNTDLRKRLCRVADAVLPGVNSLGLVAALAAYRDGDEWLSQLLPYLTANRDYLVQYIAETMPDLAVTVPQATYLAWIDCAKAGIAGSPKQFFVERGRVAFHDGAAFGPHTASCVRLNFGASRSRLCDGLQRMRRALAGPRSCRGD
jgi:cystathionine beta-lyase